MDEYETLDTLERVFSHPWFCELRRCDNLHVSSRWVLFYRCNPSGPTGGLYAETYPGALLAFRGKPWHNPEDDEPPETGRPLQP